MTHTYAEQERDAITVAAAAHRDQSDKLGEPYIGHVARVAARLDGPVLRTVAWLHDVIEDTDVTADRLRLLGFDDFIVEAVEAITHLDNEPNEDYLARVVANPIARLVKLADVADNSDPARLALLDSVTCARLSHKYAKARQYLESAH